MADYYPRMARAIAGLDPSAPGESRRALYERARAALIAQLRSVQPPLSESEITRERLSLEEAVRKVESEAAQRAREASRAGGDRARSGDAFRANARPNPRPGETAPPSTSQASRPPSPQARNERPPPRQADRSDPRPAPDREPKRRARTGAVFTFKSAIAVGIVLILVGAAILWGKSAVTAVSGLFKSQPVVEAPKDASPLSKPKIPDRVGQPSSTEQLAPVAQRVVLYDEDPSDPKGKQYVGSVIWRTEQIKASAGQKADIAVRADVDIPDRKFKMTISFRRNTDSSLPASHTAELTFILPPDFSGGGVGNVPGILMKSNEQARGTPLGGLAVKATDGFFLGGLANVDADRQRNLQLLKERSWFDVPLVYVNQRRAIIAIEKGSPGERAFNDAFATWGE